MVIILGRIRRFRTPSRSHIDRSELGIQAAAFGGFAAIGLTAAWIVQ